MAATGSLVQRSAAQSIKVSCRVLAKGVHVDQGAKLVRFGYVYFTLHTLYVVIESPVFPGTSRQNELYS